jgi:hypothetical protein
MKTKNKKLALITSLILLALVILGILLYLFIVRDDYKAPADLPLEYESLYGFELNYNSDWEIATDDGTFNLVLTHKNGASITISLQKISKDLTLESILRSRVAILENKDELTPTIEDNDVKINKQNYKIANITFTDNQTINGDEPLKIRAYATLINKDEYMVIALTSTNSQVFTEGEKLVNTIRFF